MLCRYAGFDPTECAWKPKAVRGPGSRFSTEQIEIMISMAEKQNATSLEIGAALKLKPEAIRAKLNKLGVSLRRHVLLLRVRMVIDVTRRMRHAAMARGITPQQLIRRLLQAISKDNLFDSILPIPRAHSLGAAAASESKPPVTIIRASQFAVVL